VFIVQPVIDGKITSGVARLHNFIGKVHKTNVDVRVQNIPGWKAQQIERKKIRFGKSHVVPAGRRHGSVDFRYGINAVGQFIFFAGTGQPVRTPKKSRLVRCEQGTHDKSAFIEKTKIFLIPFLEIIFLRPGKLRINHRPVGFSCMPSSIIILDRQLIVIQRHSSEIQRPQRGQTADAEKHYRQLEHEIPSLLSKVKSIITGKECTGFLLLKGETISDPKSHPLTDIINVMVDTKHKKISSIKRFRK
jgi:hypothetical protein